MAFARYEFDVKKTDDVKTLTLWIDYDDAFVAYLNGVEITRCENIYRDANWNTYAFGHREAQLYQGNLPRAVWFDSTKVQTLLTPGRNVLAVSVHDASPTPDDMSLGVWLVAGVSNFVASSTPLPHWLSRGNALPKLHTDFKLSAKGETVFLLHRRNGLVDSLRVNAAYTDHAVVRLPDGARDVLYTDAPTPGRQNTFGRAAYAPPLSFDKPSGFYNAPFEITFHQPDSCFVFFTTDGSSPTDSSRRYTKPFRVDKTTVLRARAYHPTKLPGPESTASFFIDVKHTTPVLSVITAPENLFSETGIFIDWRSDKDIPVFVEYWDSLGARAMSQRSGMQVDGGAGGSRSQPQQSFRLELDNGVLGDGAVQHTFIPTKPRARYNRLYLRNGSNQYMVLPQKDACQVTAMANGSLNYHAGYRPVSVYINGNYYGLYELREKFDRDFFAAYDGATPKTIDLLSHSVWNGKKLRAVNGSVDSFYNAYGRYKAIDPQSELFWERADSLFDMAHLMDYIAAQTWMGNTDWPDNNIRVYRSDKTNYRWRFVLQDLEIALAPNHKTDHAFDHFAYMENYRLPNLYLDIWKHAMKNTECKNYFVNRLSDLMNTTYRPDSILEIETAIYNWTAPEMLRHFERWKERNQTAEALLQRYENNRLIFRDELTKRPGFVRQHLMEHFNLSGDVLLTVNAIPQQGGSVRVNTVSLNQFPWSGLYCQNIPIQLEAFAKPGYRFVKWVCNEALPDSTNPLLTINAQSDELNVTAAFEKAGLKNP